MKRVKTGLIFIIFCILLVGCTKQDAASADKKILSEPLETTLETAFINVGKGDCMVLTVGDKTLMIDTGYGKSIDVIAPYLEKKKITKIDYLILTHFDKDHIGSADHILRDYEVESLLMPSYTTEVKQYLQLEEAIEEVKITPSYVTKIMEFSIGDAKIVIYPPLKSEYKQADNDFSLAVHVTYGNHSYFFAGDAEKERIEELLTQGEIGADVFKVPHHGRIEKNSKDLIDRVHPSYAVITSSEEEPADEEELELLKAAGCDIYLMENGNVVMTDDGVNLDVKQG